MRKTAFAVIAASLLFAVSVRADDDIVAKINGKIITNESYSKFVDTYPPDKKKFLDENLQNRRIILERMIQVLAVADMAKKKGLDKDPAIQTQVEYFTKEILAQEMLKTIGNDIAVTDKDIDQYYKAHLEDFKVPEMVHARHILIRFEKAPSEAEALISNGKAKEKAESILARIRAGEDFAKLAEEYSDDNGSKAKGGDLGFFPRGKMVPAFENAAFSLKPGQVSDLIETNYGYHIIKVEERQPAGVPPLEKVKEAVREKIKVASRKAKIDAFMDEAFKEDGVELHLDKVTLPQKK
ncbi:MAG: peptidylprolyl isomerase [Nitrospiraceae bacterium]|nr:peptidylprolyl isomerase [Nitrospiraceae bacterium]